MVVSPEAIICISSVTAIPVRFVRNLWREFLAFIMIFYVSKLPQQKTISISISTAKQLYDLKNIIRIFRHHYKLIF
jgi:hypothetical protein